jgi:hypothetical protein
MTEDQANVISVLTDVGLKILLTLSSIGGFWYILVHIINSKANQISWALVTLDAMLSGTLYYIIAHYFPAFKAAAKRSTVTKSKKSAN